MLHGIEADLTDARLTASNQDKFLLLSSKKTVAQTAPFIEKK